MIGYAEILQEDLILDGREDNAADAQRIGRAARGQLALIDQILDFSQLEAGRVVLSIGEVDIDRLIDEVTQTVAPTTTARGTRVSVEVATNARRVRTDERRLRQCLLNLMSNAAKFTEGGRIHLCAAMEVGDLGDILRIDVSDTGCGISKADEAKLFQPFTQVDGSLTRKEDGAGLGLVIADRLSRLLGGGVSFESLENVGTTFTLRVLASEAGETSAQPDTSVLELV